MACAIDVSICWNTEESIGQSQLYNSRKHQSCTLVRSRTPPLDLMNYPRRKYNAWLCVLFGKRYNISTRQQKSILGLDRQTPNWCWFRAYMSYDQIMAELAAASELSMT